MTKNELLNDLKSKDWCDSINGIPELKELKDDGGRWYLVNIREVNSDGQSAVYRNIHFYVVNEGLVTEKAYYKDSIPTETTKKAFNFTEKVNNYIESHSEIMFDIENISEKRNLAIIKKYTEDVDIIEERYLFFLKDEKLTYKKIG